MPLVNPIRVEVEFAKSEPKVVGVKGNAPPPATPHGDPMFESVPFDENVAQPAVPPAEETMSAEVEAVPEIVSAVVEAYGNIEATLEVEVMLPAMN